MLIPINTFAASPPAHIQIQNNSRFTVINERIIDKTTVLDTLSLGDTIIKIVGRPGSVSIEKSDNGVSFKVETNRPKTLADAHSNTRTAVQNLIELGMSPADAKAQFGDMDTLNASSAEAFTDTPIDTSLPATVSTTVPYAAPCYSVSTASGVVTGRGCDTIFLTSAVGSDWYFKSKYKFTASSSMDLSLQCILFGGPYSYLCPWRLVDMAWALSWASGNSIIDWEPYTTIYEPKCGSVSLSGFGISVGGTLCPDKLSPWDWASYRSGAEWKGTEKGTDYEAVLGIQEIHSPPSAPVSYSTIYQMVAMRLPT